MVKNDTYRFPGERSQSVEPVPHYCFSIHVNFSYILLDFRKQAAALGRQNAENQRINGQAGVLSQKQKFRHVFNSAETISRHENRAHQTVRYILAIVRCVETV